MAEGFSEQNYLRSVGSSIIIEAMANAYKKLVRPQKGRVIAGVATGLANYLGVDPVVVRIVWVILALPGGAPGLLLYVVCWILIPEE